jgi:EF hand
MRDTMGIETQSESRRAAGSPLPLPRALRLSLFARGGNPAEINPMKHNLLVGLAALSLGLGGSAAWAHEHRGGMLADGDGNGAVSRSEAQAGASKAFARMDANGDGALTPADREARMAERRAAMFDRLDADKNGQISRKEFAARPAGEKQGKRGHRMGMGMGMWGERGGAMMMQRADANSDGRITQAEFTAAALARFDRTDADRNGEVTAAERKAMRENWRAMRRQGSAN